MTPDAARLILQTITNARKKRFQLVGFRANDNGLIVDFRSNLSHPEHAGRYFAKFGLEASPRLLENDGIFTMWFREVNNHAEM